jgi:hypothetical protein
LEIIELYISEMDSGDAPSRSDEEHTVAQLNYEYLMIDAAAHGQLAVCEVLLPHCHFKTYTT